MINLNTFSFQRGGKPLFEDASLQLFAGQRVAIVGINGCGKSTLFKLIQGQFQSDKGDIDVPKQLAISHMEQEISALERPACDYILDGYQAFRTLQQSIADAEETSDNSRLSNLYAEMDAINGYTLGHQAEKIMLGLGFTNQDYLRPVKAFSGGWRIRLNLARALLCPSDVLLLDEPTNHLDLEAITWLEQWLNHYEGTVLLISHDRDFIDATSSHIAHIDNLSIQLYTGSYSDFERQKAEHLQRQESVYKKQQQRKAHLQQFIDRFKAQATKAKQAQSRIKALEKMQLVSAVRETSPYQFTIPNAEKNGSPLLNGDHLDLGYRNNQEEKTIVNNCDFSILPGMRIGLLGENGAGKSTLIKTLAAKITPIKGDIIRSEHLKIGYFDQHQVESLDFQASPILHIQRISPTASEQQARDFLGQFKIHGDMAVSTIQHFSGGEKARLALALLAWQKPNLLLLDEPTNHLDIDMRQALADALQSYEGAVLLVSHDRYLLRHCVDDFWHIDNGQLRSYTGDLNDYYTLKKAAASAQPHENNQPKDNRKENRQKAAQQRAQLAPITQQIKQLEKDIERVERQLQAVRHKLGESDLYEASNKSDLQQCLADESQLKNQLATLEPAWFNAQDKLEELQKNTKPSS